ncbi:hypothetical protein [Citrobacter freundii]|uniref:hypothetical protein n=3 Tax=Citrobacter freundii TaxID=546 RepID=UPI003A973267
MSLVKMSLLHIAAGIIPIPLLFIGYKIFPSSDAINFLFSIADGYARSVSNTYYIPSTIASVWVKLGPLFAILTFLIGHERFNVQLKENTTPKNIIIGVLALSCFIAFEVFIAYFGMQSMSSSWHVLQVVAGNISLLCVYYMLCFIAYYFIGWLPCLYISAILNTIKKKNGAAH